MNDLYNRYVPQNDGTWRRSRVEPPQRPQEPVYTPIIEPTCTDIPEPPNPPCEPSKAPQRHAPPKRPHPCPKEQPVMPFLKNLLPNDFDTGDLLILLLLLLMAGDNPDDRNHALLTLAIYFFL